MLAYKPGGCSWCRSICHTSHSDTGSLQCVCACVPADCASRRMHVGRMYTHEAVVRHVSSYVSEDSTCAGKRGRRPRIPPVFHRYVRARGHAVQLRSQICAHILCSDDVTSAHAQFQRGRTLPLHHHRQDTAPDVASVHTVISLSVIIHAHTSDKGDYG